VRFVRYNGQCPNTAQPPAREAPRASVQQQQLWRPFVIRYDGYASATQMSRDFLGPRAARPQFEESGLLMRLRDERV